MMKESHEQTSCLLDGDKLLITRHKFDLATANGARRLGVDVKGKIILNK